MIYTYFISYQFVISATGKWGFGRMEYTWPEAITHIDQLTEVEKRMTLSNPGSVNLILNYTLMRIESEAPTQAPAHDAVFAWPTDLSLFKRKRGDTSGVNV